MRRTALWTDEEPQRQRASMRECLGFMGLGALQTLAFVYSALAWWLPVVTLAVLVWRLNRVAPSSAARIGWAYSLGWLTAGVWWLFISMYRYGNLSAPLSAAALLALCAALALYYGVASTAYAACRSGRPGRDALVFAAAWTLAEWARAEWFTGFPWVALGYAWVDAPLVWAAPWVGVYGLGFLAAWAAASLAHLGAWSTRGRALVLSAWLGLTLWTAWWPVYPFTQPSGELSVSLLQTNVDQQDKFSLERLPELLDELAVGLEQAQGDLVMAPETAVPLLPAQLSQLAPGWWEGLVAQFQHTGRAALVGVPLGSLQEGYTNSVLGLSDQPLYRYDKHHLVPFGEFIPVGFRWFTAMMNLPLGDFDAGPLAPESFEFKGQRIAPNVCYEDLFGEELAARMVRSEGAPTILANFSNIAWFGHTVALPQHLNITRMRTVELQRPMLRATNTGVTAVVTHEGQVAAELPVLTAGVLEASVQGRVGTTAYAWWAGHWGLWPLVTLCAAIVAAAWARRRGRTRPAYP